MLVPPAEITTHRARTVTQFTNLLLLTRAADSQKVGFTDFCRNLDYDDGAGSITYHADPGIGVSAMTWVGALGADQMEITLPIDGVVLTLEDVEDGLWRKAQASVYEIMWFDTTAGRDVEAMRGLVAKIELDGAEAKAQIESLRGALKVKSRELGRALSPKCGHPFGGSDCGFQLSPAAWQGSTAYAAIDDDDQKIGDVVRPTVFSGYEAECSVAGTSAASPEPTWPASEGGTVVDGGTLTWRMRRAYRQFLEVDTVESNLAFTVKARTSGGAQTDAPDDFFLAGHVAFDAPANNALFKQAIKSWTLSTKRVEVRLPFPRTITPGDQVELVAGCLKRNVDCNARGNRMNRLAADHVPGEDQALRIQRA